MIQKFMYVIIYYKKCYFIFCNYKIDTNRYSNIYIMNMMDNKSYGR
jgi:hypothetical protein